jgi:hypothetical protein
LGLDARELEPYFITKNLEEYTILNKDIKLSGSKERILMIKNFLTKNEFEKIVKIVSSILLLGNAKLGYL